MKYRFFVIPAWNKPNLYATPVCNSVTTCHDFPEGLTSLFLTTTVNSFVSVAVPTVAVATKTTSTSSTPRVTVTLFPSSFAAALSAFNDQTTFSIVGNSKSSTTAAFTFIFDKIISAFC